MTNFERIKARRMMVFVVRQICDWEYGYREVVKIFNSETKAENWIKKQPDKGKVKFWDGSWESMYEIERFEVE